MSWILRKKKKIAAFLALAFLFTSIWWVTPIIWGALVIYAYIPGIFRSMNSRVAGASYQTWSLLHNRTEIRKIHTLVIGDTCQPELTGKYAAGNTHTVQFPDRSLQASWHIFMHMESVLEENGRLIIIHDNSLPQDKLTIFDLPYLSLITLKELDMEKHQRKLKYPLLWEPFLSFKYLRGYKKDGYERQVCPLQELNQFCKERGIDLIYLCRK